MPGSGKSTMAKYISSVTKLKFVDLDDEIEKKENRSINEIFNHENESYFRNKESEILKTIIEKENHFILSTGGGTPCFKNNLEVPYFHLQSGFKPSWSERIERSCHSTWTWLG